MPRCPEQAAGMWPEGVHVCGIKRELGEMQVATSPGVRRSPLHNGNVRGTRHLRLIQAFLEHI